MKHTVSDGKRWSMPSATPAPETSKSYLSTDLNNCEFSSAMTAAVLTHKSCARDAMDTGDSVVCARDQKKLASDLKFGASSEPAQNLNCLFPATLLLTSLLQQVGANGLANGLCEKSDQKRYKPGSKGNRRCTARLIRSNTTFVV